MEAQVQNAIEIAFDPSSDPSLKYQAYDFLNQLRNNPSAWLVCLSLFTKDPSPPDVVRHMALDIVNNALQSQQLDPQNATSAKVGLMEYVRRNYGGSKPAQDSGGLQNKLAQTLIILFNILYESGWESFFHDLHELVDEDVQAGNEQRQPGMTFYLRILGSIHDEIADQMIQTSAEKAKVNMHLKDLIRERDAQYITSSWQEILSRWQSLDLSVVAMCLNIISKWISWTDINSVANDGTMQYLFQIAGQRDTGHPESPQSKARDAAIGVFTEIVAKKMKASDKVELLRFLNVDTVVAGLVAAPTLQNTSTPDYDTDMAEIVARLVNNVVLDTVNALSTENISSNVHESADRLLQSFTPHLLRFLADEYDEVCSTIMPALTEQLGFFRKLSKRSQGLPSTYRDMLAPILQALIAKMRYDDTSAWGEEDEETDEAEFQELRKRLKVAQQNIAAIDEDLYLDQLARMVESTFNRCKQEGSRFNWRDLDVALLEMYMLGELAVRNSGLYQKKLPSSEGSQRLIGLMTMMMDCDISSFSHPTAQLQVMEISVRYHGFFEQQIQYLPKILEDFVRFVHSDNVKVRHRAWHHFLRFVRALRTKLGDLSQTIIQSISDLLAIRAVIPEQDDGDDSSDTSSKGPRDPTFQSQLFLFEAVGALASIPSLDTEKQANLLEPVLSKLLNQMETSGDVAARGDERASYQTHHYIEAMGTLARGFSDWVPGKTAFPVPEKVASEFRKASSVILVILNALKASFMIREASRFAFVRFIGVLGFNLLERLPHWIDGLLSSSPSREELSNFYRLVSQLIYGFKGEMYDTLDKLLTPLLERTFAAFSRPTEGTDDTVQQSELRREYLNFITTLLQNKLEGVLVSPTNQSNFETIISTLEHFSRDTTELSDARSAVMVLYRMADVWGGPNVFTPSPSNNITNAPPPTPVLPGFDQFMISRFSGLTWSVMTNPSFHPKDGLAAKVVNEIATLQQIILSKTGAMYVSTLQQKELPGIGLQPPVIEQYLHAITTMDTKSFRQWLATFLQQGPNR